VRTSLTSALQRRPLPFWRRLAVSFWSESN
jgi:hypothetical protein